MAGLLGVPKAAYGDSPPPPRPLDIAEKVARATHVFLAEGVKVMYKVSDHRRADFGQVYSDSGEARKPVMMYRVLEVLYPGGWEADGLVHTSVSLATLGASARQIEAEHANKRHIYFLRSMVSVRDGRTYQYFQGVGDARRADPEPEQLLPAVAQAVKARVSQERELQKSNEK